MSRYVLTVLAALLAIPMIPWAQAAYGAVGKQEKGWTLNLKDVDIHAFLEQVSTITGENFVLDPQVKGVVTVIAPTPMSKEAVHELLLTVLRVNGLTAVVSPTSTRVIPQGGAKLESSTDDAGVTSGQQLVTRVIPLKNADVDETVKILKPLISSAGYLEGSIYSNALIVSDYADNLAQILKALKDLDNEDSSKVEVIPIKDGSVDEIVPLLEAMAPMQIGENKKGRNRLRVLADERSNSIVVRGDKKDREEIRSLVETLDQKTTNHNSIQMIRLHYADAKEIAPLLRGMLSKSGDAAGAAPPPAGNAAGGVSAANAATLSTLYSAAPLPASGPAPAQHGGTGEAPEMQSFIQADISRNALIVRADPTLMSEIRSLVAQLDVRSPQVLIEAAIVEITADASEQLGMQLAAGRGTVSAHSASTQFSSNELSLGSVLTQLGSATAAATTGEGLAVALGTKGKFDVLVQALASVDGANLLSTPSITTLDNEEAKIVVGQNVPFRSGSFTTLSSGVANPFTTIERQDIGITLKVVPQINEGNLVRLNIEQEVSSIANTTVAGAADLITNKRSIQTNVLAEDGETVVLGGLLQDDTSESVSKIPLLGDIPVIGTLFRDNQHSATKENLIVFLRPTVLWGRDQMAALTQERYGRVYELQLGRKKLIDDDFPFSHAGESPAAPLPWLAAPAPSVDTVFNPPAKALPWLIQ